MPKIETLYAWVSIYKDDTDEGVVAWRLPNGDWIPLIGADKARIESLRMFAVETAKESRKAVRLLKFTTCEEIEVVNPI